MLKKLGAILMTGFVALGITAGAASAGEMDLLLQKLVEKGVLTANEAQILTDETKQEVAKQNAKGTNEMIPSWVQTVKVKGDVRLRYQTQQKKSATSTGGTVRNRGRVRMRLGVEAKPGDKFKVGAGLATGEDTDARSTNETLGDGSGKDYLWLDYAWAEYKPMSSVRMIGGKYNALSKNYLWYTTDMLWDSDINQEGASIHVDVPNILMGDAFLNGGYWTLSESATDAGDAGMFYGQAGMNYSLNAGLENPLNLKFAGTYYSNQYPDSNANAASNPYRLTNGKDTQSADNAKYQYSQVLAGSAELVYNLPAETSSPIKMVGVFGDYVNNPDVNSNNTGWATGLKFGHPKVGAAKGDWQFKYQYVKLESYAWIDIYPDSDRYSGVTNVKGHEAILDIGLAKNVSLGLDYYRSDKITGASLPESIFQADLNFKF